MKNCRFDLRSTSVRHRWLIVLLGLALVIHFLLLIPAAKGSSWLFVSTDAVWYERLPLNIITGNGYSLATSGPYTLNSTIVPLHPLFVTGVYASVGRVPYVVIAIQIILSLGVIAWMIRWGAREFSPKTGIIAGALLILNVALAFHSVQFMTDVLFLTFLVPALWLVLQVFEGNAPTRSGLGAGVLFGLGALTRPVGLYFPLILPFLFLLRKPNKQRLRGYGVLLLSHIVIVSPWFIRNRIVFGHLFFSTVQGYNLLYIHAAPVKIAVEGKSFNEASQEIEQAALERYGEPRNEAERLLFAGREAMRYLIKHPVRYAGLYAAGVLKVFLPMGLSEFLLFYTDPEQDIRNLTPSVHAALLQGRPGEALRLIWEERVVPTGGIFFLYVAAFLFKLFIIGLALRGFLIKGFRSPFNLLAFIVAIYFIGVTGPAGQPRHFLPLLPLAALLAAHGLIFGLEKTNTLRRL
ncbi:hypothetical protein CEE36_05125 [candidate division TA06 bacterium B3_TA06]|uniref:Glycosyltransferase RgtA/B/C/D-like domain-containing protein n=1 Tax=candidate division TA06 bacterium B3_TA06 TaxID=2012487 RepID=A0A532V7F5_UNCT6|nr:MAG: hypothetical protein CEE36_05125 [candidate division TA06 bacterium B3_TA06]